MQRKCCDEKRGPTPIKCRGGAPRGEASRSQGMPKRLKRFDAPVARRVKGCLASTRAPFGALLPSLAARDFQHTARPAPQNIRTAKRWLWTGSDADGGAI